MASSSTAGAERSVFKRDPSQFCDNPSCLGIPWHEWIDSSSKCQLDVGAVENSFDQERFEQQFSFLDDLSLHPPVPHPDTKPQPNEPHPDTKPPSRFATPKTREEIAKSRMESVPKRTRQDTEYCVRLWHTWSKDRCATTDESVPPLLEMDAQALQFWMINFILEVRSQKCDEYYTHPTPCTT